MEREVLGFKAISLVGRTRNFRGLEAILSAPVTQQNYIKQNVLTGCKTDFGRSYKYLNVNSTSDWNIKDHASIVQLSYLRIVLANKKSDRKQ